MRRAAGGHLHAGWWAMLGLLLAGGCYAVPPPLMYGADPVPAGHLRVMVAATGTALFDPSATSVAPPVPGMIFYGHYGLGHGASVGLRFFGAGAMADGRIQLLHTPRLSLSLGLALGADSVHVDTPIPSYCQAPYASCSLTPPAPSPLVFMGSLPLVLGWHLGRSTLSFGLRPGARVSSGDLFSPGDSFADTPNTGPLAGALVGFDVPVSRRVSLELELDVTQSFVHPGTVATLAVGISH